MKIETTPEQRKMALAILLSTLAMIFSALGLIPDDAVITIDVPVQEAPVVQVSVPESVPEIFVEPVVEIISGGGADMGAESFSLTGSGGDFDDITATQLDVSGDITAVDVTASGDVSVAGTFTSGGITQRVTNGGSSTSVVSGTEIAHGIGTTPTVALLTPSSTTLYTITAYILTSNTTTITIGTSHAITIPVLYWYVAK